MTPFDPSQVPWRTPWHAIAPDRGARVEAELHREMDTGHVLFGRSIQAIGCRQDCDDVLFYLGEPAPGFAVVHLTYQRETSPEWPSTVLFATLAEWVEQCLIPDAEDFDA